MARLVCLAVAVLFLVVGSEGARVAYADPPKGEDRVKQLEKRVADLEKEVADLRAQLKLPPKPALDNKLIGSWGPAKPVEAGVTGLRLELDGTFRATFKDKDGKHELYEGKYQVVGKALAVTFGRALEGQIEILSVTAKELIIRTRMFVPLEPPAEYKLERQ
jgi:hypothetical protein